MSDLTEKKEYETLPVPDEAVTQGGVELLRVAMISNKLYLSIRPGFKDPADWGEVLAEITRRIGLLYEMEDRGFSEADAIVAVEEAYAAEMGARPVKRKARRKSARGKTKRTPKKAARKSAKRKKR
jgi:hypothetical protein